MPSTSNSNYRQGGKRLTVRLLETIVVLTATLLTIAIASRASADEVTRWNQVATDATVAAKNSAQKWTNVLAQNAVSQEKGNKRAKVNVDSRGVILKGYDAVAYIKEGKPVKGAPEIKSSYQGATYLFASVEDRADFDKDPPRYAPQYGGFCAYGISLGVLGDIEDSPEAFVIYNGKLYICGNAVALKKFRDDIETNIEKADKQWRRISKL
jgi:YHS domain-containing protein